MKTILESIKLTAVLATAALMTGCASNQTETKAAPKPQESAKPKTNYKDRQYAANPSKVKFGEFKYVELKKTELNPRENSGGNRQSAEKIDEILATGLKSIWPDLKVIPPGGDFSKGNQRTLQISPRIEHIHIVSVGARVFGGVLAGGSDLVMHVDYGDSSTGEVIANPDIWRGNNAWAGRWSEGATDNQIRDAVVAQIVDYTLRNK